MEIKRIQIDLTDLQYDEFSLEKLTERISNAHNRAADRLIKQFLETHGFTGPTVEDCLNQARIKGYELMRDYHSQSDSYQIKLVRVVDAFGIKFISNVETPKS